MERWQLRGLHLDKSGVGSENVCGVLMPPSTSVVLEVSHARRSP